MTCVICGREIKSSWIGTGRGEAHRLCYLRSHPPRVAKTVPEVLRGDDPILACELLETLLTPIQKGLLINTYNEKMTDRYKRRLARYEEEDERETA